MLDYAAKKIGHVTLKKKPNNKWQIVAGRLKIQPKKSGTIHTGCECQYNQTWHSRSSYSRKPSPRWLKNNQVNGQDQMYYTLVSI